MSILGAIRRIFSREPSRAVDYPRMVRGTYDAARTGDRNEKHWVGADCLDADAAHSPSIRRRISTRARMETGNNGFGKGINLTQANYVVGLGPMLQMGTQNKPFNAMVEARWKSWAKRSGLARKLRTACKAKVSDGESFIIVRVNPNIADAVKLDLVGIECEQCASPNLPYAELNRIDGIKFDEFGNVLWYEVLKRHPGGQFAIFNSETENVPARYMLHWYREDRPGQHRGISEITPTLNRFAEDRRYREATIAAAENIANLSVLLETQGMPDDGPDASPPFQAFPMERGMITQLPYGHKMSQPKSEQPTAGYGEFVGAQISEEARPLNMPRNIAACDSSDYSFSGGQLDHLTYFVSIDVERDDCENMVLDKLFEVWFPLAVEAYGWTVTDSPVPSHSWSWPARPVIDGEKVANASRTNLSTGCATLRQLWAAQGQDFDDVVTEMANDYGVSEAEVKKILIDAIFKNGNPQGQQPAKPEELPPKKQPAAKANGHNRLAEVLQ
jgi:capsid protein